MSQGLKNWPHLKEKPSFFFFFFGKFMFLSCFKSFIKKGNIWKNFVYIYNPINEKLREKPSNIDMRKKAKLTKKTWIMNGPREKRERRLK